jgi:hypothetical protein
MGIHTKLAVSPVPEGTFSLVFSDATLGQQEGEGDGELHGLLIAAHSKALVPLPDFFVGPARYNCLT